MRCAARAALLAAPDMIKPNQAELEALVGRPLPTEAAVIAAARALVAGGVRLVVVSPTALAPYSGMVPGWLAGTYRFRQICIDVQALCAAAGATRQRLVSSTASQPSHGVGVCDRMAVSLRKK